jgi:very-short-patch-repair endonuclease
VLQKDGFALVDSIRPLRPSGAPPRSGEDLSSDRPNSGEDLGRPVHRTVGASKVAIARARQLRKEMSLPEVLLWVQLQKRPGGHRFRKQMPQPPYTLDFVCLKARLAIEVDGEAHNRGDQPQKDIVRDRIMAERGFRTLRISAYEVLKNMEGCLMAIVAACGDVSTLPSASPPPPRSGEGL